MISDTVSVFGASGFIGSHYVQKYGGIVVKKGNLVPPTNNILWLISTVDNYNIFTEPTKDILTNQVLLVEMLERAHKLYGSDFRVTFISSWFVYGEHAGNEVNETSQCNPTGFYSITKRAAEQMLISYCETFGSAYLILRLANIIGKGDRKASTKKNAIQHMIQELAKGKNINLYKNSSIRDVLSVSDAVDGIELCMQKSDANEIYNIGSGIPCDVNNLIREVAANNHGMGEINEVEVPQFHKTVQTRDFRMSIDKIKRLGFTVKTPLLIPIQEIIREAREG